MFEIIQAKDYSKYFEMFDELELGDEIVSVSEFIEFGKIAGFGIYHFNKDTVFVDYIECYDDEKKLDGIARSILFIAFNKGINKAVFNIKRNLILNKLNYVDNYGKIDNIINVLDTCKSCKNK